MNPAHSAAYLVLLKSDDASKALLFNADHHYLSEVIDDGFIVDTLTASGRRCIKPRRLSLDGIVPEAAALLDSQLTCFELRPNP